MRQPCFLLPRLMLGAALALPLAAPAGEWPTVPAQARADAAAAAYDGTVEAVRQSVLAAQVPGAVLALNVKVGDSVRAGQVLARIDARAAEQGVAASSAALEVATREVERKRQLFAQNHIARAALEQAEAQYRSAQAQDRAARAQTGWHEITAPFAGVVAVVAVEQGDMVMPGRPLITVYDPAALRVSAAVPVAVLARGIDGARVQLGGQDGRIEPARVQVLPTVDPASMTRQVRADLPAGQGAAPGQFARLWLPVAASAEAAGVWVPRATLVRRSEMTGVYVLDAQGVPLLRQVRLGPVRGDQVEIISGLAAGERVVTEPQTVLRRLAEGGK
ncbi:MAG: efflux RND transporter periplasmic adaptor subunit [Desulfobulbus sp.]|nr:efflux RND transporter periplasmic adaptor subunit [Desulfobulbus sp.]